MPRSRATERLRHLALAALYFALLTPAGLCARAVRDPLRRSWDRSRTTYLDRPAGPRHPVATSRRAP
ncbi:hypothetical protein IPZ61_01720 [Streptomyces sioyaensis]|uniref:hypothetical protein n=1 Tax=Streptomyces sioyaensis TaxID=67364 RepID=UPI001F19D236|nr:hypothetical protein [Streptomyces sioyaensis]MCF3172058.1 hypothetical protein [Streptomyces sioyaensis]